MVILEMFLGAVISGGVGYWFYRRAATDLDKTVEPFRRATELLLPVIMTEDIREARVNREEGRLEIVWTAKAYDGTVAGDKGSDEVTVIGSVQIGSPKEVD